MAFLPSIREAEQGAQPWGTLLESFYSRAGLPMPHLERLLENDVPQPYRRLLVHSADLTPTLESFYQHTLGLMVLSRRTEGTSYLREVVLHLAGIGKRVAYGVIRIALEHLPAGSANRVLQEQEPFGNILQHDGIPHLSWPQAFFSVDPDAHIKGLLRVEHAGLLYGRRNVLLDSSRRLLAEVVEILAPAGQRWSNFGPTAGPPPGRNGSPERER